MFNGSVQVVIPLLNRTGAVSREIVSPTQSVSNDWKHVSFNTTLPADAGFFTARFVAQGTDGWVQMRNIELNFTLLEEDPSSLFGTVVPISGGNLSLRGFHGYPFIQFEGNGSLRANDQTTNLLSPNTLSWRALPGPFDSPSVLSGNVNVSAIMVSRAPFTLGSFNSNQPEDSTQESIKVESPSTVVFSRPFAPGYRLGSPDKTLSPRASIDGLTLFSDVPPGTYAVSFPPINVARAGYIISLGFIFGIITLSTVKHFRGNLSRRRLIGCNASNLPATATFPLD